MPCACLNGLGMAEHPGKAALRSHDQAEMGRMTKLVRWATWAQEQGGYSREKIVRRFWKGQFFICKSTVMILPWGMVAVQVLSRV